MVRRNRSLPFRPTFNCVSGVSFFESLVSKTSHKGLCSDIFGAAQTIQFEHLSFYVLIRFSAVFGWLVCSIFMLHVCANFRYVGPHLPTVTARSKIILLIPHQHHCVCIFNPLSGQMALQFQFFKFTCMNGAKQRNPTPKTYRCVFEKACPWLWYYLSAQGSTNFKCFSWYVKKDILGLPNTMTK